MSLNCMKLLLHLLHHLLDVGEGPGSEWHHLPPPACQSSSSDILLEGEPARIYKGFPKRFLRCSKGRRIRRCKVLGFYPRMAALFFVLTGLLMLVGYAIGPTSGTRSSSCSWGCCSRGSELRLLLLERQDRGEDEQGKAHPGERQPDPLRGRAEASPKGEHTHAQGRHRRLTRSPTPSRRGEGQARRSLSPPRAYSRRSIRPNLRR